jgi:hypothetical protein
VKEAGLPGAGATAMSLLSSKAPLPVRVGAAAFGGEVGKAGSILWNMLKGEPPKSLIDALSDIGMAGREQGLYEIGGEVAGKALGVAGKAILPKPVMEAGVAEAEALAKPYVKATPFLSAGRRLPGKALGVEEAFLMPQQVTRNRLLDIGGNLAEYGIAAGAVSGKKEWQGEISKRILDDWAGAIGKEATPEEAGELFIDLAQNKREAFQAYFKGKYAGLDNITKDSFVDITALKNWATDLANEHADDAGIGASIYNEQLIKQVSDLKNVIPFSQADRIRSKFGKLADQLSATSKNDPAIGIAKKFSGMMDRAIDNAGLSLSGDAKTMYRGIRREYGEGVEKFNASMIRRLMYRTDAAEKVMPLLISPGSTTYIRHARNIVGSDSSAWKAVQRSWADKLIADVSTEGIPNFSKFNTQLKKYSKPTLYELLGKEKAENLFSIARLVELSQKQQGSGAGRMFIQLKSPEAVTKLARGIAGTQLGGAGFAAGTGHLFTAGGIIVGPVLFGRMLVNPVGQKLLREGLTNKFFGKATSPGFIKFAVRFNDFVRDMNKQETMPQIPRVGE